MREKATCASSIHAGTQITQLGFEGEDDVDGGARPQRAARLRSRQARSARAVHAVSSLLLEGRFDQHRRALQCEGDRTGVTAASATSTRSRPASNPATSSSSRRGRPWARPRSRSTWRSPRRASREQAGRVVLARNVERRDRRAPDLFRGASRRNEDAPRQHQAHEWEKIVARDGTLNDLPIYLDDRARSRSPRCAAAAPRSSRRGLSAIAFIDYLQLLRPGDARTDANRNEELSEICRDAQITAKDLKHSDRRARAAQPRGRDAAQQTPHALRPARLPSLIEELELARILRPRSPAEHPSPIACVRRRSGVLSFPALRPLPGRSFAARYVCARVHVIVGMKLSVAALALALAALPGGRARTSRTSLSAACRGADAAGRRPRRDRPVAR